MSLSHLVGTTVDVFFKVFFLFISHFSFLFLFFSISFPFFTVVLKCNNDNLILLEYSDIEN